jgi:hypothetical protein
MLAKLLSQLEGGVSSTSGIKCVPSYVAPDLAYAIRRHISQALRQRKGPIPCYYISELATYTLPPGKFIGAKNFGKKFQKKISEKNSEKIFENKISEKNFENKKFENKKFGFFFSDFFFGKRALQVKS